MGEGILKDKVPEAHTDYIIAVISEEFGALVIILLMIIFLFFIYQVFKKLYFENLIYCTFSKGSTQIYYFTQPLLL